MSGSDLLPDIIDYHLKILFIGFNPGMRSGETGHHYAGHSNRFWKLLHDGGLTDRQFTPFEDQRLLEYGYGLTNIVGRTTRTAAEITAAEYLAGRDRLRALLAEYRPRVAAFNGIEVYRRYCGQRSVQAGVQHPPVVPGIIEYAMPSPSGLVRTPYSEMVRHYATLRCLADKPVPG